MEGPRRKPIRLVGWDYATPGHYFVTLVTQARCELFGKVHDGEVALGEVGRLAEAEWIRLSRDASTIALDAFVVMPNHLHGIVGLSDDVGPSLSEIVRIYKSRVTRRAQTLGFEGNVWQRGFHDRILRDQAGLEAARRYIAANPSRWAHDPEAPRAR
jgi:REP element-mobilizing transposase RayT